ncbi:hypothetical protein INR49_024450, partial [Caranx melampygus]
ETGNTRRAQRGGNLVGGLYTISSLCRMSPRKMLQFSTGALLLLLPWFSGLVLGRIVDNFDDCKNKEVNTFFYNGIPPTGITGGHYQPICQHYKGMDRFATLYDRERRSALYSAYILNPPEPGQGRDTIEEIWMYEPQIAKGKTGEPAMQPFPTEDNNVIDSQAVLKDYQDSSLYTRGHLAPFSHLHTEDDRVSTFTLTNIVPQRGRSNNFHWSNLENEMTGLKNFCQGKIYVITGVIPGNQWLKTQTKVQGKDKETNKVNIPHYLWSAYCCPNPTPDLAEDKKSFFPTYAAIGSNIDKKPAGDTVGVQVQDFVVTPMSLAGLEQILRRELKMEHLSLFDGQCISKKGQA